MFRFASVSFINTLIVTGLAWLVVLVVIFYGSDGIYSAPAPVRPAYDIAADDTAGQPQPAAAAPLPARDLLAERLQNADASQGARLFGQCAVCHSAAPDGARRIGPNLWHVVGRRVASSQNFSYSRAMQAFAKGQLRWDLAALDSFLAAPARKIPGTIMSYGGLSNAQQRADLLLYLESLSEHPPHRPVGQTMNIRGARQ